MMPLHIVQLGSNTNAFVTVLTVNNNQYTVGLATLHV